MGVQTSGLDQEKAQAVPDARTDAKQLPAMKTWRILGRPGAVSAKNREDAEDVESLGRGAMHGPAFESAQKRPGAKKTAGAESIIPGERPFYCPVQKCVPVVGKAQKAFGKALLRSAPRHSAGRDVVAVPVVDGKGLDAHAGPGLGAVNEVVLADVDARVVAGTRNAEDDDIARAQTATGNALSYAGLIAADAGHGNTVAGTGPVNEAGTVETAGRRGAAGNVGTAELTFGRGGYGSTAAGGDISRLTVIGPVGLLTAASGHEKGHAQKKQRKIPIQGMSAICRHDGPAGVEAYNTPFVWYLEKSFKFLIYYCIFLFNFILVCVIL